MPRPLIVTGRLAITLVIGTINTNVARAVWSPNPIASKYWHAASDSCSNAESAIAGISAIGRDKYGVIGASNRLNRFLRDTQFATSGPARYVSSDIPPAA